MNILIIKGKDNHTHHRIVPGFTSYGCHVTVKEKYEDLTNEHFDIIFVDPSVSFDPSNKLNTDILMFYDCEDSPYDFNPGVAYEVLKDKVIAYAKMNWVDNDRKDEIKNIGFPLYCYKNLYQIANADIPDFSYEYSIPIMIGSPTFIGGYKPIHNGIYNHDIDVSCFGKHETNKIDHFMYNQRIDWLLSLRKNNIFYIGGLTFTHANLTLEWQANYFGNGISKLSTNRISYSDMLNNMVRCRIGLCPTGHERISWRTFDLMAIGSILIWTDNQNQQSMIMPKEYITIKDGEDLGTKLLSIQKDYKDIWKACQKNKESLKLDDQKVLNIFHSQYK
jgi:hypothetical protein